MVRIAAEVKVRNWRLFMFIFQGFVGRVANQSASSFLRSANSVESISPLA